MAAPYINAIFAEQISSFLRSGFMIFFGYFNAFCADEAVVMRLCYLALGCSFVVSIVPPSQIS